MTTLQREGALSPILAKAEAAELINTARIRRNMRWADIATALDAAPVWTTAALLGQHPMSRAQAEVVCELLGLGRDVAESLQLQPSRGADPAVLDDPTIYRLTEAISVYGPALKALIHEEFGDGIMSAINFRADIARRPDPDGDRVIITLDGKFLDYRW
jgi:cyanate lyase